MFISCFWDSHKCRNCFREGIYGSFLFLRWVRFFSKRAKTSFLLSYLNHLNFLVLFQNSQTFSCYMLALGGSYTPDKAQFLLLRNRIHFRRSKCMMKSVHLFICGGTQGPEIPALLPLPWPWASPGSWYHSEQGQFTLCLPEIRFSSVIQPQEVGTAVIPRNVISGIIHKVTVGKESVLGVGGLLSACKCVC